MNSEEKLELVKQYVEDQKRKLEEDKKNLKEAANRVLKREVMLITFEKAAFNLTPQHPYDKNNKKRCNFCHKQVNEGMLFCPHCQQKFTWDDSVEPIVSHFNDNDPIKETNKIFDELKENHI